MDRTIKITLGIFIVILIGFVSVISYDSFVTEAYRTSMTGSYSYTLSLTTDSALSNVTLFVPVPEDPSGNSLIVTRISAKDIPGLPAGWTTTLFDTGEGNDFKDHDRRDHAAPGNVSPESVHDYTRDKCLVE